MPDLPTLAQIQAIAAGELGTVEVPPNQVEYNTSYYRAAVKGEGYAWCQVFAWWVQNHFPDAVGTIFPSKTASTVNAASWYKKRGLWGTEPRVGAQPFYNISGLGRISHTGVAIEHVYDDGSFAVVEGNTNAAGSRTGGMVVRQKRKNVGEGGGFGYPVYSGVSVPIVLPLTSTPIAPTVVSGLVVDGDFGPATKRKLQQVLGIKDDGIWGDQSVRALQRNLAVVADGKFGPQSVKALQRRLGVDPDGKWGPNTTKKLQIALNERRF